MSQKTQCFLVVAAALWVVNTSLYAAESEGTIERSFQQTYVYETYLKDDAIRTGAKDGVVTLTGTVAQEFHKALAQETVASLPGVTCVDNQLEVTGENPAANSDVGIRAKVQSMLTFHRSANNSKTEVDVVKGLVILRGNATSLTQREMITQYAKAVEGVTEVQNEMTVAVAPVNSVGSTNTKIDDPSITALVKMTLRYHGSDCVLANEVKTSEGVVWLSGKAHDIPVEDQDKVAMLLADICGVMSVIDTHHGITLYGYYEEPASPRPNSSNERLAESN